MVQSNAIQDVLLAAITPIMTIFCTRLEQHNLAAGLSAAAAYTPADARDIAAYSSVDKSKQQLVWDHKIRQGYKQTWQHLLLGHVWQL